MAEETTFQSVFGQTPGQLGLGAAGTFAGGALNYFFNSKLQDKQFAEQEKLQRNAAKLNAQAVRQQAQLQAQGMSNAGLNPASVNGAGAPSVQAGAAAGSTSQLATIFQGVAEIVAAAKAPSEVENTQADTGLKGAQTENTKTDTGLKQAETEEVKYRVGEVLPAQVVNLNQATEKLFEETRNAKNVADLFDAQDAFIKGHSAPMFDELRTKLKQDGTWDKMLPKTRETIDAIADGNMDVGIAELQGLKDLIDGQVKLSDADKTLAKNGLDMAVIYRQLNDPKILSAIAGLPEAQKREIEQHIVKMAQEVQEMVQAINESKQRVNESIQNVKESEQRVNESKDRQNLIKADTNYKNFQRENDELNSPKWLWKNDREGDAFKAWLGQWESHVGDLQKQATGAAGNAIGGYLMGRGMRGGFGPQGPTEPHSGPFYTGGLRGYQNHQYNYNHPNRFEQSQDLAR